MNPIPAQCASGARWMIVDDNQEILALMCAIVGRLSDAVIESFNSPQAALAAFTAAPDKFQFVITDLEMPGMNGIELCRRLVEIAPKLKVLLATGSGFVSDDAATDMGFCGLLHKPFPLSALRKVLDSAGVFQPREERAANKFENTFKQPPVFTLA
jgi:CheY-like chemotaxis protein